MRCYVHALEGGSEEAVAVCAVCGMSLCMEHATERDMPTVRPSGPSGSPERATLILCPRDAEALPAA